AGDRGPGRSCSGGAGDPAPQPGGVRDFAGRAQGPPLPRGRGGAGRHRPLRPVFAHGTGAGSRWLQCHARAWRPVRTHRLRRHPAPGRCGPGTAAGGRMSAGHCILSHGFESGPDATKVTALAAAAETLGFTTERPDYTDLDARSDISRVGDVQARLQRLVGLATRAVERGGPVVLAGSSLGAYISAIASLQVPTRALFLMVQIGRAH